MNEQKIRKIFLRFKKANPHPTTELKYHNNFQLLVAVMLSAQSTDKGVNKATDSLFKQVKKPQDVLDLGIVSLKRAIQSIGLYHTKAKNILKTAQLLLDHFKGRVPNTREALESLPGVGRKTANVILNTCFGEPVIAVDTHIFRVANRIGLVHAKTPAAVEIGLNAVIPAEFKHDAHHWLILHGRYTCVARKPHCPDCIIADLCEYPYKTTLML